MRREESAIPAHIRAQYEDGIGNAPPDWYIRKLEAEREARAQLPPPPTAPAIVGPFVPKHVLVWSQVIRTAAACTQCVLTTLVLLRVYGVL